MEDVDTQVLHDDLKQLCEAVGIFSGAQPVSPHEVFQKALIGVNLLRDVADAARDLYHREYPKHYDEKLGQALTNLGTYYGPTVTTL